MVRRGGLAATLAAFLAALVAAGPPAAAQEGRAISSPVLTIDQEALFAKSAYGRRIQAAFEAASTTLAAENRRIEAELEAEEQALTDQRPGMDAAAFRERAAAFDAKVVEIRRTQDQKARDLARAPDESRQQFYRAAVPLLAELVRERGAVAILDNRAVLLAADAIDITDEAIARIDAELGDGSTDPAPPPSPAPGAVPAPPPDPAPPSRQPPQPATPPANR